MTNHSRDWAEHPQAVASLLSQAGGEEVTIGGRFVCCEEALEESMWAFLEAKGLSLRNFGQCETVAMRLVRVTNTAVEEVIVEMRQIALEGGYRLQSIEAGDVDSGEARVLAGVVGYVPWWDWHAEN